jgi:hypothetical protein
MKTYYVFFILLTFLLITNCSNKKNLNPEEAKNISREAYIYGFPMVMGYKAMNAYVLDENNPEYKGPFNFLACDARLLTPEDKAIVTPNSDTPYCMMWCDISSEPVVISVPEMEPERFYHFQFVDLYTHNFAYIGSLTTGNGSGKYLVSEYDWQGEIPDDIDEVIQCETPLFFVIVRTQLFDPGDIENVKAIQDGYTLQTLNEYLGGNEVPKPKSINIPEWNEGDQFTVASLKYLDAMLDLIESVPEEEQLMKEFARLGIGKNGSFNLNDFEEDIKTAIEDGIKEGFSEIENFIIENASDPLASAKIFGTRSFLKKSARDNYQLNDFYLLRAAAAHMGLYGNSAKEALYPVYIQDGEGLPFDASAHNYTITFEKDQLPPVKSFWSLTMYDGKSQLLVNNELNRYLLNSSMINQFKMNEDGSLNLYIQKDNPGEELESNWLPAPNGPFYAVLRLYGPEEPALEGIWINPSMKKVN